MTQLLNQVKLEQVIAKMSSDILADLSQVRTQKPDVILALVGIRSRGVPLAQRIAKEIQKTLKGDVLLGALDITLYRDDLSQNRDHPVAKSSDIPFSVQGKLVYLVDDVLFTGRTIRCALDAVFDFGRPAWLKLAVLVDRGGRELPIQADIVGLKANVPEGQQVKVSLSELDGNDEVTQQ
jgi:pyrimidine operon attenuation protein/uracil phosphoribosyltransferase